jgi:geranylgeranyl diphosphate synthase type I
VGEALGICAGDIAFFLAFEHLAEVELAAPSRARLISLFARELSLVGAAQMMDMVAAAGATEQTTEEILRLYLYKTGRYTFSLPLLAGAEIGGIEDSRARELEQAGEQLGMLFQIKDDEIGLFGDPAEAGKPVGSDVREGKKTIFHASLMRRAPVGERDRIRTLWGRADLADADVLFILDAMARHGVRAEVEELVSTLADRAEVMAARIGSPFLGDLLAYSLDRRR